jgi:hypothetical protein
MRLEKHFAAAHPALSSRPVSRARPLALDAVINEAMLARHH